MSNKKKNAPKGTSQQGASQEGKAPEGSRPAPEGQVRPQKPGARPRPARAKGNSAPSGKPSAQAAPKGEGDRRKEAASPGKGAQNRRPRGRGRRRPPRGAGRGESPAPQVREKAPARPTEVVLPPSVTVRELAEHMQVSPIDVIKTLMNLGIIANINQQLDFDTAAIVASEMGVEAHLEKPPEPEKEEAEAAPKTLRQILAEEEPPEALQPRPPVVTVLGHVDHGKTTLLDAIRDTNVVAKEAGGITQRIGAYQVEVDGKKITFLDTPGHEAFTAMRARGAQVTDLAVLVVAADDGVMPQTREAIDHARAANVPILVALNKIDKPNANPDRVKQQLADLGLTVEDWGGDVICVPISAKQRIGIDELLENILLVTEVADLRANPNRPAKGTVIEGRVDRARGVMATLLVQAGTLRVGDVVVVGEQYGRVRAMFDDKGQNVNEAPPSTPVAILGLSEVPEAGEIFEVVADEKTARAIVAERLEAKRTAAEARTRAVSLEDFFQRMQAGEARELNIVLKASEQGAIEPLTSSLEQLSSDELKVNILHAAPGEITESDVMLAAASNAIVIGFAVGVDQAARRLAEAEGVDIRVYEVIYQLLEHVDKALKGLLEPVYEEEILGHAEVRAVFRIPRRGAVAGCYVLDGQVTRNAKARIRRGEELVYEGQVASLKRFKDDVREVAAGFECGIGLEGFEDFEEGDIIEFYTLKQQGKA
ncbi:MAG: translation initiation factor IF-2 [Anaerolineae bacterium]|nr:translation initiation factor IF-2 [Anaerolineae bacterium]